MLNVARDKDLDIGQVFIEGIIKNIDSEQMFFSRSRIKI